MKSPREYYITRSKREKALVWAVVSFAVLVLFYYGYVITFPGDQEERTVLQEKAILLRKLQGYLNRGEIMKAEADTGAMPWGGLKLIQTHNERQVLTEIPRFLKELSAKSDLILSKDDIIQKQGLCKDPLLLRLEIAIEIESIPKVEQLKTFLYGLENNNEFTCNIRQLRLKRLDEGQGVNLSATFDVFALIKS